MGGRLDGRTVLITGAAGGIGTACARRLAAEGARLLLADVTGDRVGVLATELGQAAIAADVTRTADVERMVDAAYGQWGRVDVLFNNAGVIQGKALLDVTEADWDRVMAVNARAVFFVLQAVARRMVRQAPLPGSELRGKLIQTASIAADRAVPAAVHYAASKAAVVSITRTAAQAFAADRITSNCVCPGIVDTPMWAQLDADITAMQGRARGEAWRRQVARIPLGRAERPEDVAGVVSFLASADSDYLTGQAITVDGGLTGA